MKRIVCIALIAMMAAMLVIVPASAEWTMYVYTDNGKTLNVRSEPYAGDNILGRLEYGTMVTVRMTNVNGWACIDYNKGIGGVGYVQSRFLVSYRPDPKPDPGYTPVPADTQKAINAMNAEFRSARQVTPYTVAARPSRATGWVNLRWAPSIEAERIGTCPQGKELTVLAELNNWLQVVDPTTGMIGFISRQFVTRK